MRHYIALLFLALLPMAASAQIVKGAGILYFDSIPNVAANTSAAELAFSIKLKTLYRWCRTCSSDPTYLKWVSVATVDTFSISGNTLRLSLFGDREPVKTVDLSPYLDNTDSQVLDTFAIVSNVLRASLSGDGQPFKSVNLSPYLDNTDSQYLDTFSLSGTTLRASISGDGQLYRSVNLGGAFSSGNLTYGNGTANYLPKWLNDSTLTNSIASDNGSLLTIAGGLAVNTITALSGDSMLVWRGNQVYRRSANNLVASRASALNLTYGTGSTGLIAEWLNDSTLTFDATGAYQLSVGTDAQRPTGVSGLIRYNTTNGNMEYYGASAWEYPLKSAATSGLTTSTYLLYGDANGRATGSSALTWTHAASPPVLKVTGDINMPARGSIIELFQANFAGQGSVNTGGMKFMTNVTNGDSRLWVAPNGTGTTSGIDLGVTNYHRIESIGATFNITPFPGGASASSGNIQINTQYGNGSGLSTRPLVPGFQLHSQNGATFRTGVVIDPIDSTNLLTAWKIVPLTVKARQGQIVVTEFQDSTNTQISRLKGTGQWRWNKYGSGTFAATPTYLVGVDANKDVVEYAFSSLYTGWTMAATTGSSQAVGSGQIGTWAAGAGLTATIGGTRTITYAADTSGTLASKAWVNARSITFAGTSGTPQPASFGQTVTIAAGTGLTTTAGATRTVTVAADTAGTMASKAWANARSWTLAGDSGTGQAINWGNTATLTGGWGIVTSASATDVLTIRADSSEVASQYDLEQSWLGPRLVAGDVTITSNHNLSFLGTGGFGWGDLGTSKFFSFNAVNGDFVAGDLAGSTYKDMFFYSREGASGLPTFIGMFYRGVSTSNSVKIDSARVTLAHTGGIYVEGSLGVNDNTPEYSADFGNNTDALELQKGTTAQRPINTAGAIRWNTDTPGIEYATGSTWKTITDDTNIQTLLSAGNLNVDVDDALNRTFTIDTLANYRISADGFFILEKLAGTGLMQISAPGDSINMFGQGLGMVFDSTIRLQAAHIQANNVQLWRERPGSAPYSLPAGNYAWISDEAGAGQWMSIESLGGIDSFYRTNDTLVLAASNLDTFLATGLLLPIENLGPELVTNGNFDTNSDWTLGASWSIAAGVATTTGGNNDAIYQQLTAAQNDLILIQFKYLGATGSFVSSEVFLSDAPGSSLLNVDYFYHEPIISTDGWVRMYLRAPSNNPYLSIFADVGTPNLDIDSVSAKKLYRTFQTNPRTELGDTSSILTFNEFKVKMMTGKQINIEGTNIQISGSGEEGNTGTSTVNYGSGGLSYYLASNFSNADSTTIYSFSAGQSGGAPSSIIDAYGYSSISNYDLYYQHQQREATYTRGLRENSHLQILHNTGASYYWKGSNTFAEVDTTYGPGVWYNEQQWRVGTTISALRQRSLIAINGTSADFGVDSSFAIFEIVNNNTYSAQWKIFEANSFNDTTSNNIKLYRKYRMPNAAPSTTIGDTTMMVWVGLGSGNTEPMFIPLPAGSSTNLYNSDGTLPEDRTVSMGGYTILWESSAAASDVFAVDNNSSGTSIRASSTSGVGVNGVADSGVGVYAVSTSGLPLQIWGTATSKAIEMRADNSNTNGINVLMRSDRGTSGTAATGIGQAWDQYLENASGSMVQAGRHAVSFTDVTGGSVDSKLEISLVENSSLTERMEILSDGQVTFSGAKVVLGNSGPQILSGSGSPESVVTAPVGSLYLRTDGGAGTTLYIKESGTGNTGWMAK